ncbi:MAG TPA: hypothetical protein VFW66_09765 [Gemmatimonadales bacterium]|nr:hypothetical protein [Gemmatimonadales bacterium]
MAPNRWVAGLLVAATLAAPGAAYGQEKAPADSGTRAMAAAAVSHARLAVAAAASPATPAAPPAATTVPAPTPPAAAPAHGDSAAVDSLNDPAETQVAREMFAYSGAPRDPFASLIKSAHVGPELSDLQLVAIYEDMYSPAGSVAVLRDKTDGKRHKLRSGDQLGRLRVTQIRAKDVVFTIQDFGVERQETLSLRKQEDATQ